MQRPLRPALFADRDGTIIVETHYLSRAEDVVLIPGAAAALRAFAGAGHALVIVTNQSGIARGYYTEDDYQRVNARVLALLSEEGVSVDGVYHCPHHPDVGGPCDCRKPGTALYLRAAADLGIDLARSIFVGDRRSDIEPARVLGGRGFLVLTGHGAAEAGLPGVASGSDAGETGASVIAAEPDISAVAARVLQLDTPGGPK